MEYFRQAILACATLALAGCATQQPYLATHTNTGELARIHELHVVSVVAQDKLDAQHNSTYVNPVVTGAPLAAGLVGGLIAGALISAEENHEAHEFAEMTPEFAKLGATVIGMSNDDIDTLKRFSTEACRDKFAVAAATPEIVKAYDAALVSEGKQTGLTERTSYVIDRKGRIAFVHSDLDYKDHVRLTLAAVKALQAKSRH